MGALPIAALALAVLGGSVADSAAQATVSSVTISDPEWSDTFTRGEEIVVSVVFDQQVTVNISGGTPRIRLEIGSFNRLASFDRLSPNTTMQFKYAVVSTDRDTNGITVPANGLDLNGGTITTTADSSTANLGLGTSAISDSTNHKVDGRAPAVSGVAIGSPAVGDTFERDELIDVTVTFDKAVDVTGTPQLALTVGSATRQANWVSGSGSASLVFRYQVVSADADADGISIGASALTLNSGTIDLAGSRTLAAGLGLGTNAITNSANHKVSGSTLTAPDVSDVSFTNTPSDGEFYRRGEWIEVRVTFTRAVAVTGTPRLALTMGTTARYAEYTETSGSTMLLFGYTVAAGDADTDGISIGASALTLNGGGINDARDATVAANLGLGANAVSDSVNHKVDGGPLEDPDGPSDPSAPPLVQVTGVRVQPLNGALRVSWSPVADPHGSLAQYRVDVRDGSGDLLRRIYTEADVHEATVDGLENGVEYSVTVSAVPGDGGANGPPSEARTATPRVGAGDPEDVPGAGDPEDVPVPALPLAGAGVLAGLLASAAYRFRRADPGGR